MCACARARARVVSPEKPRSPEQPAEWRLQGQARLVVKMSAAVGPAASPFALRTPSRSRGHSPARRHPAAHRRSLSSPPATSVLSSPRTDGSESTPCRFRTPLAPLSTVSSAANTKFGRGFEFAAGCSLLSYRHTKQQQPPPPRQRAGLEWLRSWLTPHDGSDDDDYGL